MSWNYRIIAFADHFGLHEVHYDAAGNIASYTAEPITFVADPEEGVSGIVDALASALQDAQYQPVLQCADLPSDALAGAIVGYPAVEE